MPEQRELRERQQELEEDQGQAQLLEEEHENEMLAAQVRRQAPAVHADGAAVGAPVQEQAPAKETFKQRQRDKKKAREARKICPVGTAATYDMVRQLQDHRAEVDNSIAPFVEDIRRCGADGRALRAFSQGYRKDKRGRPLTEEDARKQREDREFLEDYCAGDLERRRRHLERIVREVDYIKFPADPFSVSYMQHHLREIKDMADKLVYLENIMKDPINKEFFDNMDPMLKDRLDDKGLVAAKMTYALAMHCAKNGVSVNYAVYFRRGEEENINQGRVSCASKDWRMV